MAAKLTRLNHKIAIQLHLVAESYTISSSRSRRPFRKLLDTPWYVLVQDGSILHKIWYVQHDTDEPVLRFKLFFLKISVLVFRYKYSYPT
jgi:hypothetical protein